MIWINLHLDSITLARVEASVLIQKTKPTNEYDMYLADDKIDTKITIYYLGDDRTQLNPEIQGGMFFKVELIYRIQLPKKE